LLGMTTSGDTAARCWMQPRHWWLRSNF